jgi:hypothetical protein
VSAFRDGVTARNFADVPLTTADERREIVPAFAERMGQTWRQAFAACGPFALIGNVTGMHQERAARILAAAATPTRQEAATIDAALRTNASRLFPRHSTSIVQNLAAVPPSVRSARGADVSPWRRTRIAKWATLFAAYGRSLGELSAETRIAPERLAHILNHGARMTHEESLKMTAVLGPRLS